MFNEECDYECVCEHCNQEVELFERDKIDFKDELGEILYRCPRCGVSIYCDGEEIK